MKFRGRSIGAGDRCVCDVGPTFCGPLMVFRIDNWSEGTSEIWGYWEKPIFSDKELHAFNTKMTLLPRTRFLCWLDQGVFYHRHPDAFAMDT